MSKIITHIVEKDKDKTSKLINEPDEFKKTPLHYATLLPGQAIVKLLLENGGEKSLFKKAKDQSIPINLMDNSTISGFLDSKLSYKGKIKYP